MHHIKILLKAGKIFFVLFFLITLSLKAQIAGEGEELSPANPVAIPITENELIKSIPVHELEHPYLFFNNQDKQAIINRLKNEPESEHIFAAIIAEGHRFLHVPIQDPEPPHPKHNRYLGEDPASQYEDDIMQGAVTLAFLYQMTGDTTYANKAVEFAMDIADWPTWVDPAHRFDVIYSRVWPFNVPDDRVVFSYGEIATHKALALSIAYDWIYPVLSRTERDKIRNGLMEKVITNVRNNYKYFWWSTAYKCNWSVLCYSSMGVAALSLLKDNPELLDVVAEVHNRIDTTFSYIGKDGGWEEGRNYYAYMMSEGVYFMDALKRLTNGKQNMFKDKNVADHPIDFQLYGLTANFEDGGGSPVGPTYSVNKLVEETGNNSGAWYREKYLHSDFNVFEAIWPKPDVKPIEPEQKSKLFRTVNWAILRSSFRDSSTVTVACKAGYNDDPHHGHLDCGQYAVTWYNVPFIRDLGNGVYDELYFGEDKYDYPYASSLGHNLIFVNGEKQITAKKKNTPWLNGIGGRILEYKAGPKLDYVLMDPTHAYPNKQLIKWRRNVILEKPVTTVVFDEVESEPGAEITARIHPGVGVEVSRREHSSRFAPVPNGKYEIMKNYVMLSDQRHHNMAVIPLVLDNDFKLVEGTDPFVPVTKDSRLTGIPYIEAATQAKTNSTFIATIIVPVKDQNDADKVVKSAKINQIDPANIHISVNTDAGNFSWTFLKGQGGYVLKD
jgi:Heparinase II/III-like protein